MTIFEKIKRNIGINIRKVDMFGIPNSLVFGRSLIYKSKLSGLISLAIYIFFVIIITLEWMRTSKRFIIFFLS
jgi:hypothetical protein